MIKYEHPMHIANFLTSEYIEGFCNTFILEYIAFRDRNLDAGVVPLLKNKDYGFYLVDYGFMIHTLEVFVKKFYKIREKNEELGIEIANKIHQDFAQDHNENLTKNGTFFLSCLAFYDLVFISKKSKTLYVKNLIRNNQKKNFVMLNSISVNLDMLLEKIKNKNNIDELFMKKTKNTLEVVAFGVNANHMLKAMKNVTDVYQIWDREKGFNNDLFEK